MYAMKETRTHLQELNAPILNFLSAAMNCDIQIYGKPSYTNSILVYSTMQKDRQKGRQASLG